MLHYDKAVTDGVLVGEKIRLPSNPVVDAGVLAQRLAIGGAPASYYEKVFSLFRSWKLIPDGSVIPTSLAELGPIIDGVKAELQRGGSKQFYDAWGDNPWDKGYLEAEYDEEELEEKQPIALELSKVLGEKLRCFFRYQSGDNSITMIEREGGKRQVVRVVETEKTPEEISVMSSARPKLIPEFEGAMLPDGRTVLLIEFIKGKKPRSNVDRQKCADELLSMSRVPPSGFDFGWGGNFVIEEKTDQPYFVDSEAITEIMKLGYQRPTVQTYIDLLTEKTKLCNDEATRAIAQEVDRYLIEGRPGLDGELEKNLTVNVARGHDPDERLTLSGQAALYTLEVVGKLNEQGQNLAAVAIQAETLNKMLPPGLDLYIPFRRHGFAVLADRNTEKWSLIDYTLNQFVSEDARGGLIMAGSNMRIRMSQRGPRKIINGVANSLIKEGYVELNLDNLVAYLILMAKRPVDNTLFTLLREGLSVTWSLRNSLDTLVQSCLIGGKSKTGDWGGSLQTQNVERFLSR